MYLSDFPADVRTRTLVSRSKTRLKAFLKELDGPAVLKPLAPRGGEHVFYLRRRQVSNLNQMIAAVTKEGYALAQEYLPEAEQGEKRLLLLNAEPLRVGNQVAIYRRRAVTGAGNGARGASRAAPPAPSSTVARPGPKSAAKAANKTTTKTTTTKNGAGAATRGKCDFGPVEARICDILRPRLLADGLTFVAVDIVGDRVLELNVFTPGGLHPIHELYGIDAADVVIADLERRVRLRAAYRTTFDPEAADVV
jgi:glutathione synthase